MMRRITCLLIILISVVLHINADQEINITLGRTEGKKSVDSKRLNNFAYVTFDYYGNEGNKALVRVSISNITQLPPLALILFKHDNDEGTLEDCNPKIQFLNTFTGEKGKRMVLGCKQGSKEMIIIPPGMEDKNTFTLKIPLDGLSPAKLNLPFYLAKYNEKDLLKKKDPYKINYKIRETWPFEFNIEIEGWNENDEQYKQVKDAVDKFVASVNGRTFCNNPAHSTSLTEQWQEYSERQDQLITEIKEILDSSNWLSNSEPFKAYDSLLKQVSAINLDAVVKDCGKHKRKENAKIILPPPSKHACIYCSLSSQALYYKINDTYQKLYKGSISKSEALKIANGVVKCNKECKTRKSDKFFTEKINNNYTQIKNR